MMEFASYSNSETAIALQDNAGFMQNIQFSDLPDLLKIIRQMDALKVALESVDQFHQHAVAYARLEASALIRVVELGGLKELKGTRKKAAEWLSTLSDAEREKYIEMCADGLLIENVYKREIGDNIKLQTKLEFVERERTQILNDVQEHGIVDIKPFSEDVRSQFSSYDKRYLAQDIIDGMRNRLRSVGAVGIGNNSGIYVMPSKDNGEEVKKAILLRYESIADDMESIYQIAKSSGVKLSFNDFGVDIYIAERRSKGWMCHLLIAFASMGVIEDCEEMYSKLAESSVAGELKSVHDSLKISADDYIRLKYKKLMERESNEN